MCARGRLVARDELPKFLARLVYARYVLYLMKQEERRATGASRVVRKMTVPLLKSQVFSGKFGQTELMYIYTRSKF